VSAFLDDLRRGSRPLTAAALLHVGLALLALALMPFDDRHVLGLDPWVKPFKFMLSVAVFLGTLAWMAGRLHGALGVRAVVGWGVALSMVGEAVLLWMQSARGTTSHFNMATAFDSGVFAGMGVLIGLAVMLVLTLLVAFLRSGSSLPPATLWGIRLGLAVFLLGSIQGGALIANGAHAVGVPDGGPGLPLVNWSTEAGDLRVAHGIGLHGLQVFPILGCLLSSRAPRLGRGAAAVILGVATAGWLGLMAAAHMQAMAGRPLVAG
jgi:hypothetical protein